MNAIFEMELESSTILLNNVMHSEQAGITLGTGTKKNICYDLFIWDVLCDLSSCDIERSIHVFVFFSTTLNVLTLFLASTVKPLGEIHFN